MEASKIGLEWDDEFLRTIIPWEKMIQINQYYYFKRENNVGQF